MRFGVALTAVLLSAAHATAHPHIFVDTELRLIGNDQGQVTALEMTWTYDDFFSLLIFEDMGLDRDVDGVLTEAELDQLRGFDLIEWPEGFEGDIYLTRDGAPVVLTLPEATGIAVENGRIVASHRRDVDPVALNGLELRQYDPTYYVAYTLQDVQVPEACRAEIDPYDAGAAAKALDDALREVPEEEFEVLELGINYADTVTIQCETGT